MLEISNVTKRFHSVVAVDNITLRVPRSEVLGVLGPNGAGKTTLFKLIAGFLYPDKGIIRPLSAEWPTVGYKPERLLFPGQMRVRQYMEMAAALSNVVSAEVDRLVDDVLAQVDLTQAVDKRIKDCSKGMRQRLALAQAMIGDPALLLLDEPSNGLDPEGQAHICQQIEQMRVAGKTVVLASHQLLEVTQVCTQLIILNKGSIHYENTMVNALAERPHTVIRVDKGLGGMKAILESLHGEIEVLEREIVLNRQATGLRRQVMSIVLAAGFDVLHVEQSRVSLAEIYSETIK